MRDHTKNILITLLLVAVAVLIGYLVGYAAGAGKVVNIVADVGIKYLNENNITILGLEPNLAYDRHKIFSIMQQWLT